MSNNKPDAPVSIEKIEPVAQPSISLDEFCTRLSETVLRPELIGGFAYSARARGNLRATAGQFQALYTDFINQPV